MNFINIEDLDYHLPENRIAIRPLDKRSDSKLLVANSLDNSITHYQFRDIAQLIPKNSLIIANNTKVLHARLIMQKESGASAELFLLNPKEPSTDVQINFNANSPVVWECMLGGRRLRAGKKLSINLADNLALQAEILEMKGNIASVNLHWNSPISFGEILEIAGRTPLPPYFKRESEEEDKIRYQTVYAKELGSVAAPTAGLHFDDVVMSSLNENNINFSELTLHVGLGTFQPVTVQNALEHNMHAEKFHIEVSLLKKLRDYFQNPRERRLIVVGTTSLRAVESSYIAGVKGLLTKQLINSIEVDQFDGRDYGNIDLDPKEVIDYLISRAELNNGSLQGSTKLMIFPSVRINTANGLITNFHAPKSTLIMLVSAYAGDDLRKKIYNEALKNEYRFLSYGDSSLILR